MSKEAIRAQYTISQSQVRDIFADSYELTFDGTKLQELYLQQMFLERFRQKLVSKAERGLVGTDASNETYFGEILKQEKSYFSDGGDAINALIDSFCEKCADESLSLHDFIQSAVETFAAKRKEFDTCLKDIREFDDMFTDSRVQMIGKLLKALEQSKPEFDKSTTAFFETFKDIAELDVLADEEEEEEVQSQKQLLIQNIKDLISQYIE